MGRKDVYDEQEKKAHIYKAALRDFHASYYHFNRIRVSDYNAGGNQYGTPVYGKS